LDNVVAIVSALGVILLGVALFVAVALHRKRAIETSGYEKIDTADSAIVALTVSLFDTEPTEIHQRKDPNGQSWLVFVDTGDSESSGCVMVVSRAERDAGSSAVLLRSGRRIPKFFRKLEGGVLAWTEPMDDAEASDLAGTGWFAYKGSSQDLSPSFKKRLFSVVRIPQSKALLGIAVVDPYLVIWSDAARIKSLLVAAPLVRTALQQGG
jgi:hypothetical protein